MHTLSSCIHVHISIGGGNNTTLLFYSANMTVYQTRWNMKGNKISLCGYIEKVYTENIYTSIEKRRGEGQTQPLYSAKTAGHHARWNMKNVIMLKSSYNTVPFTG